MSTTVTYKGQTLTTVSNQTKVLNTSGTWLEDDITLVDSSASAPTGTINISTNGTHNVTNYASANVAVYGDYVAKITSENLHDSADDVANVYIEGSTETSYNGWSATDYIPVKSNTLYLIKNYGVSNRYNAYYDSSKNPVKNSASLGSSYNNGEGYSIFLTPNDASYIRLSAATSNVTSLEIYEIENKIPVNSYSISSNGTYDITEYKNVNVAVSPTLQSKSASPTESQQTITADTGYDGLSSVQINAISSSYIGSGVTQNDSTDLTVSGATVTVPAGYYAEQETKSVASGTAGTPTATKGTVSNHSISITPFVTNTTGYITGGTKTGTAVTVSASELVSGSKSITENGTGIDVTNYATVDVNIENSYFWEEKYNDSAYITSDNPNYISIVNFSDSFGADQTWRVTWGSGGTAYVCETQVDSTGTTYDGYYIGNMGAVGGTDDGSGCPFIAYKRSANQLVFATTASAGNIHLTIEKQVSSSATLTTKTITSNGTYNASSDSADGYSSVTVNVAPSLQAKTNISPTTSSQTISADNGYDGLSSVQINAMPSMTLPTSASSSSSGTSKATIGRSTSAQYINIPTGYNGTASYYTISATPNGTVTAPSSISGTSATVSLGSGTVTLTKTVSVTPSVSTAGYVSSGTAGNSTVTLTGSLAFSTITTSSSNPSGGSDGDVWIKTS